MVKPCHVVVKLGAKALLQHNQYKIMLHIHGKTLDDLFISSSQELEMTYSNTDYKNEYWGDVEGTSVGFLYGSEIGSKVYFNFNNPFIGWPSARIGFNKDVEWNNGYNFAQGESYTWVLDNIHYKVTRFNDTDNKEFLLEIDT